MHIIAGFALCLGILYVLTATRWGRRVLFWSFVTSVVCFLVYCAQQDRENKEHQQQLAAQKAADLAYEKLHPPSAAALAAIEQLKRDDLEQERRERLSRY